MLGFLPRRLAVLADALFARCERRRQRRMLIALSDRALHDLGIGRAEAWAEFHKPFWRS